MDKFPSVEMNEGEMNDCTTIARVQRLFFGQHLHCVPQTTKVKVHTKCRLTMLDRQEICTVLRGVNSAVQFFKRFAAVYARLLEMSFKFVLASKNKACSSVNDHTGIANTSHAVRSQSAWRSKICRELLRYR